MSPLVALCWCLGLQSPTRALQVYGKIHQDFSQGLVFKDQLIPNGYKWFTGEGEDDDYAFGEDEGDDDDEDDDDEDEDEDDDEEEEEAGAC